MVDVAVESAQGVRGGPDGEVHRSQLAFGVRLGKPLPISCFATLLRRDKSLVVATDAHPASAPIGRELTDIVGIHDCIVFRVVRC